MHSLKLATAGLLLATAPFLAHADDMSYRYFQLGYMETDLDGTGVDDDLDGFATRGSIGFAENFFVFTEYQNQSVEGTVDGTDVDVALKQLVIGLGGHYGLSENLDLVGRAGYVDVTLDIDGLGVESPDESGYMLGGGLRGRIGEHVEIEAQAVYYDLGEGSAYDDVGGELLARYHINKQWALAFEYQNLGDVSTIMGGVRFSFGK